MDALSSAPQAPRRTFGRTTTKQGLVDRPAARSGPEPTHEDNDVFLTPNRPAPQKQPSLWEELKDVMAKAWRLSAAIVNFLLRPWMPSQNPTVKPPK